MDRTCSSETLVTIYKLYGTITKTTTICILMVNTTLEKVGNWQVCPKSGVLSPSCSLPYPGRISRPPPVAGAGACQLRSRVGRSWHGPLQRGNTNYRIRGGCVHSGATVQGAMCSLTRAYNYVEWA
jgi:hypothetical protein